MKWDKWGNPYRVKMGRTQISLSNLNSSNVCVGNIHSTVTDWFKREVSYSSIMMTFTISIKTSTLTKTKNYTGYQQKLFDEIKRLKEVEGYGYKRISYILYEKGYRSIRTDSILRHNYIYSIYKKGKIREKRINREFKPTVKDIIIYIRR